MSKFYELKIQRFGAMETRQYTSRKAWQADIYGLLYSSQENGYQLRLVATDKTGHTITY